MNKNLESIKTIAISLGELKNDVVFVGGATVALYIDDRAAPEPQPSEDIDCVVEIATYGDWCDFEVALRKKGFKDTEPEKDGRESPTCRKYYLGMEVDFMPIEESVLGYGNPWFKKGLENSISISLEEIEIKIFKLEYFVASKIKAFNDRGMKDDIRFSQDLEDLTELLDGVVSFEKQISDADNDVKKYILEEFEKFYDPKNDFREAMGGFLGYADSNTRNARLERIFDLILRLTTKK